MKLIENGIMKFDYQFPLYNFFFPSQTSDSSSVNAVELASLLNEASGHACSRALYFHIPFCEKICSFCPFTKGLYQHPDQIDNYVEALLKEIKNKSQIMDLKAVPISAIFFGGGTPSLLSATHIKVLGATIRSHFDISNLKEFSFEFSTTSVTSDRVSALVDIGVTHARFGLQTIDPEWRRLFNLAPDLQQIETANSILCSNFKNVLCDILYGMNGSTEEQTILDIDYAVRLGVTNIDIYPINNAATSVKLHKALKSRTSSVMNATRKLNMKLLIDEHLRSYGYVPYNGHGYRHAPEQAQLLYADDYRFIYHEHVYGYSDHDVLGFAVGAISALYGCTLTNTSSRERYIEDSQEGKFSCQVSKHPALLQEVRPLIMGLPYHGDLLKSRLDATYFPDRLLARLGELRAAGLVDETATHYRLTRMGWLWYSNIMFYLSE